MIVVVADDGHLMSTRFHPVQVRGEQFPVKTVFLGILCLKQILPQALLLQPSLVQGSLNRPVQRVGPLTDGIGLLPMGVEVFRRFADRAEGFFLRPHVFPQFRQMKFQGFARFIQIHAGSGGAVLNALQNFLQPFHRISGASQLSGNPRRDSLNVG